MPVCAGCTASYDSKFQFCPYCGRAKPEPLTMNVNVTSDDVWETCEIILVQGPNEGLKATLYFEARAIGPKGKYAAKTSEKLRLSVVDLTGKDDFVWDSNTRQPVTRPRNCQPKVDAVIAALVAEGWQPVGRGQEWYSERFRRKVKQ
jgi:hypothetical protein